MTTPAGEPVFVDTNILVFANVADAPLHQLALEKLQHCRRSGSEMWLSCQVLREFLAVRTRPDLLARPSDVPDVLEAVRYFRSHFRVAAVTPQVTDNLLMLMEKIRVGGKQVHDANIVATMIASGVRHLLTHNASDFKRFSKFVTILPLVAEG